MDEIMSILGKVRPDDSGIRSLVARHVVGLQHRPDARNIEGEGSEDATGGPRNRGRGQRREAEERRCLHDAGGGFGLSWLSWCPVVAPSSPGN